tara:strand:- start:18 stop:494 length:477 start_codon:yes stop_codon:yes gene_type:complete
MGTINSLPTERVAVLGVIDPDAHTHNGGTASDGVYASDWGSLAIFGSVLAQVLVGTMASSSTVDVKLQQASDSSGTGAKDITGKAITQLTQAGTDSDKQALINCRADELDVDNSFNYVRIHMTVGTAASDSGCVLLGFDARNAPASDNDLTSVDEIVS